MSDSKPIAYTYETAAKAVGVSADFIRREKAAGRLAHRMVGRRVTIPAEALQAWYDLHTGS